MRATSNNPRKPKSAMLTLVTALLSLAAVISVRQDAMANSEQPTLYAQSSAASQTGAGQTQPDVAAGASFTYQGQLKEAGNPSNGSYDFTFKLYDALSGGNQVGSTLTVNSQPVSGGLFTVTLDFGVASLQGQARWLEIAVRTTGGGSYTTLAPRQPITAAPLASSLVPGAVITTTNGIAVSGKSTGTGSGVYGSSVGGYGIYGLATGNLAEGVIGIGSSTNTVGVEGIANGPSGSQIGVRGTSASGYGVAGYATIGGYGIYGSSVSGTAIFGTSGGASSAGVSGTNSANLGKGVEGIGTGTNTVGVDGSATGPTGSQIGVRGTSANGYGVAGYATASGYGVYGSGTNTSGIYGTTPSGSASGVRGYNTAGTGINSIGVSGETVGLGTGVSGVTVSGLGVYGQSNHIGVYGQTNSNGYGVFGVGNMANAVGVYGTGSEGVRGESIANGTGVFGVSTGAAGVAVLGDNTAGYAGFFVGDVTVSGDCCAMAEGYTQIDNPTDPANKYLNESLVQSADMLSMIDGNATTDAQGNVIIALPAWFQAANGNFRYQLTVVGQFSQAIVAQEIADSHFSIKTDKPNVKVSWQVTGVRKDPYALAHPLDNEAAKSADDQGMYLHPAELGQPESKNINNKYTQKTEQSQATGK